MIQFANNIYNLLTFSFENKLVDLTRIELLCNLKISVIIIFLKGYFYRFFFSLTFLDHDLSSSNNRILPPGTKVDFTLTRTSDKFYLMCLETDKEEYKAKILSCVLYCPIGIMSDRLTNEIYAKWQSMPIKYFFNRLVVKSLTMPLSKAEFLSG